MNKNNTVRQAGGFILQLMPGASEEIISGLEKRIGELRPVTTMLDEGMEPEDILREILGGLDQITCITCHSDSEMEIIDGTPFVDGL